MTLAVGALLALLIAGAFEGTGRGAALGRRSLVTGANGDCGVFSISANGRLVGFACSASNLVAGGTGEDVLVRDRVAAKTELVSIVAGRAVDSGGGSMSANGGFVTFETDNGGVFVRDRTTKTAKRVDVSRGGKARGGQYAQISANGRFVGFWSDASKLVAGDTNGEFDVFVRDLLKQTTTRVNVNSSGVQSAGDDLDERDESNPALSANGRVVAFASDAPDLVAGDTNDHLDVFVRDRLRGTTERVSVSSGGEQGNNWSDDAAISADGRFVAFDSGASNLVPGDTNNDADVFLRDRSTGTTERVSVNSAAEQANGGALLGSISRDGHYVTFRSGASNLVPRGTNKFWHVFVRDRVARVTKEVDLSNGGVQGNDYGYFSAISADGRFVAFDSSASNLLPNGKNKCISDSGGGIVSKCTNVFVRDRVARKTTLISVARAHK